MSNKIFKLYFLSLLLLPTITSALSPVANFCPQLTTNMWYGNWNNNRSEVLQLQNFLKSYYNVPNNLSTGFFGRLTKKYVTQFQNEKNLLATGGVGPLTRNAITQSCGNDQQIFCPTVYQPVCGQPLHECCKTSGTKPDYCKYAKVNCEVGSPKTYGNKCELGRDGANYLYDGECKTTDPEVAPANCKVWYDGCNTCSRSSVNGPLACTLMACFAHNTPYCKEYFSQSSEAPVIKSFSGPVQLRVNEKGTWKVEATIFNNQQLTYNITWGDERYDSKFAPTVMASISAVVAQNTTFEHSYSYPGNYTVTIEAKAQNGQTTRTTSSVNVTY